MTFRSLVIAIILLLLSNQAVAQTGTSRISEIRFTGMKTSKVSYLKSNLLSKEGQAISDSILQIDVQRLKNLVSVNNATYTIVAIDNNNDDKAQEVAITFDIEEVKTLLPILNFGSVEGNTFLRAGFADINWKGKGQQLSVDYQINDGRHGGNLFYQVPRINNGNWGVNASLNRWASREPLYFGDQEVTYNYNNDGIGISAIRHLNYNQNIQLGATYFIETYEKIGETEDDFNGPDFLRQPKWLSKFLFSHNKINYDLFYQSGLKYHTNFQTVFNTYDKSLFLSLQLEASNFIRVGRRANLANRVRLGIATNNDSPFAPFVADSHVNIRGIGNRIDRGTAQVIINTEYRQTVLQNNKWGVQLTAFSDLGTWRNPGGDLSDLIDPNQFRWFVGGGVRVIYHKIYGATLRIDYGVDKFNPSERGFVIGLGQYF